MTVIKDKVVKDANINDILRLNTEMQTNPASFGQIKQEQRDVYNLDLETVYDTFDQEGNVKDQKHVYLFKNRGFNSEGTERLVSYLGWILAAIDKGLVLFVDEIDAKLHFLVVEYLLSLFNSIDKNPHNAQLIATAHNIMLMDENLRRDQIYFTSKNEQGESSLSSLSDFKNVRKKDLFSKRYLSGCYIQVPNMKKD